MFRPLRLVILIALAFVAGVFFERQNVSEKCAEAGGAMASGLCLNAP